LEFAEYLDILGNKEIMSDHPKIEYYQLTAGFEFPSQSYVLDETAVSLYLEATQESDDLFRRDRLVPPMAVTAFAMSALSQSISMPSGTIHVSQELDFLKPVKVNDTITCLSKVSRKVERGGLRLMNTDITVVNQDRETVLTGKVGFVLPEPGMGQSG
jgi:acyl dehydratase